MHRMKDLDGKIIIAIIKNNKECKQMKSKK